MPNYRRHNPQLLQRLRSALSGDAAEGLRELLLGLSNADQHTAGAYLSEDLLPALDGRRFEAFFSAVVPCRPKAFLGTFLKAMRALYLKGALPVPNAALTSFAQGEITPIDRKKVLEALLPELKTAEEVGALLSLYGDGTSAQRIAFLARFATIPASYCLFQELRKAEDDTALVRQTCIGLMQRGDRWAFNLASMLQAYFGLPPLPGTFSLQLPPFQLSRMEQGYEPFKEILLSI